jgi:hypothetical protein
VKAHVWAQNLETTPLCHNTLPLLSSTFSTIILSPNCDKHIPAANEQFQNLIRFIENMLFQSFLCDFSSSVFQVKARMPLQNKQKNKFVSRPENHELSCTFKNLQNPKSKHWSP